MPSQRQENDVADCLFPCSIKFVLKLQNAGDGPGQHRAYVNVQFLTLSLSVLLKTVMSSTIVLRGYLLSQ